MFAEAARMLGPAINWLVKSLIEQPPQGAGLVNDPIRLESRFRIPGKRTERSLSRKHVDVLLERLAHRLEGMRRAEFRNLAEDEWTTALAAVAATLKATAPITVTTAIAMDLRYEHLLRLALDADPERPQKVALSGAATVAYYRFLDESCRQIIEFITQRPEFSRRVEVELVQRTAAIQESVDALDRAHLTQDDREFEKKYGDLVRRKLDSLQLFGVTLQENHTYPLSTAYLSLSATPEAGGRKGKGSPQLDLATAQRLRVHEALADTNRVLIRGEAGSGKTTLLQWLAINSVKPDGERPHGWLGAVPFFIPLRRYGLKDLPSPEHFIKEIAPALSSEAPHNWVQRTLRSGRALVLIDGVDELPAAKRNEVWLWLHDLVVTYEDARYVITSRPPAADATILVPDDFRTFLLLPMGSADVRAFVKQWHAAMASMRKDGGEREVLKKYEEDLLDKLAQRRDLRRLATNPLLCALTCALHLDRYRQLPRDRIGLYRAALEMLLVRRDEAKEITIDGPPLSQNDQEALLAQLAYWLVRNGRSDADRSEAMRRLRNYMKAMSHVTATPKEVFDHLLMRSGVLREPVKGRIDFLHKTFQEYLAAQAILDDGDIDYLIRHAHEDSWREVVVMAVGHGRRDERERIVRGLLEFVGDEFDLEERNRRILVAAACLGHPGALDPALAESVREKVGRLVPPRTRFEADQLAQAGDIVLDLIPDPTNLNDDQGLYLLQLINRFDPEETLPVLARIAGCPRQVVRSRLASFWPQVPADDYARTVLAGMKLDDVTVVARGEEQLGAVVHIEGLRRLAVENHNGSLEPLGSNQFLEQVALTNCELASLEPLSQGDVERLSLCYASVRGGLRPMIGVLLRELTLLGFSGRDPNSAGPAYIDVLPSFVALRKLTIDASYLAKGLVDVVPGIPSLRSLAVLSSASLIRLFEDAYSGRLSREPQHSLSWKRPSLSSFSDLTQVEEITLTGWPNREELILLQSLSALRVLRVVAVRDELRRRISSDGGDYPYFGLTTGIKQTLLNLPQLDELDLLVVDSIGRSLEVRDTLGHDLAWVPSFVSGSIRPRSNVRVLMNGEQT
ncbi:NACHT domain-containing protein [Micromonospora citrea]|uniref:NACHT domain-containing protein n=1 Tax=Micromonospora citrea TaxID=47855 RepID=A0A1C6VMC5_9ACTN|nr:NACHT domain-containing protein [Micromonospora citrea]SCL67489.1 NACHT domain-containing protein [Micromonospora citrea]